MSPELGSKINQLALRQRSHPMTRHGGFKSMHLEARTYLGHEKEGAQQPGVAEPISQEKPRADAGSRHNSKKSRDHKEKN